MNTEIEKKILIAGPCSAESERQTVAAAVMVTSMVQAIIGRDIVEVFIRSPLTKEPTFPSDWTGPGEKGFRWLIKVCNELGVMPATEVTSVSEAKTIARLCNKIGVHGIFAWFGSRLFKGEVIKESTEIIKDLPNLHIGVKNPPNENVRDWEGRVQWALVGGVNEKKIFLIDRGFDPQGRNNPLRLRNIPNEEMTFMLSDKLGCRRIKDPVHSGGSPEKALEVLRLSQSKKFNGWMLYASPTPTKTDEKQRLDEFHFAEAMRIIGRSMNP